MRAIFRRRPAGRGPDHSRGPARRFRSISDAVRAGIAYVPEDRKTQGLFLDQTVEENILCGNRQRFCGPARAAVKSGSRAVSCAGNSNSARRAPSGGAFAASWAPT